MNPTADNITISLKICGNPQANSGFSPLYNVNNAYFPVEDRNYPGLGASGCYYTVSTDDRQAVYKMVLTNVRSNGAVRPGSLVIAIGIPRGFRPVGGVSPYRILNEVRDLFVSRCMTPTDSTLPMYEFNQVLPQDLPFDKLLAAFPLEPARSLWVQMNPRGPVGSVVLPPDGISRLMQDVHYRQFAACSEVVLAENSDGRLPGQMHVPVPREPVYVVTLNGQMIDQTSNIDRMVVATVHETPEHYGASLQFTIRQVLNGARIPGVDYLPETETVAINIAPDMKVAPPPLTAPPAPPAPPAGPTPAEAAALRRNREVKSTAIRPWLWYTFMAAVGVLVGLLLGLLLGGAFSRKDTPAVSPEPFESEYSDDVRDPDGGNQPYVLPDTINSNNFIEALRVFDNEDVSFQEMRSLVIEGDSLLARYEAYRDLYQAIVNRDFDQLRRFSINDPRRRYINPDHLLIIDGAALYEMSDDSCRRYLERIDPRNASFMTLPRP